MGCPPYRPWGRCGMGGPTRKLMISLPVLKLCRAGGHGEQQVGGVIGMRLRMGTWAAPRLVRGVQAWRVAPPGSQINRRFLSRLLPLRGGAEAETSAKSHTTLH